MQEMNNERLVSLRASMIENVVKLLVSLCFIFILAQLYYELDSTLAKNFFFFIGVAAVAWFHRVKYKAEISVEGNGFEVSVERTFFGYSFVRVISAKRGVVKNYKVFSNDFEKVEPEFGLKMYFDFSTGNAPKCSLTSLKL